MNSVWNPIILLSGCAEEVDLTIDDDPPPPLKRRTPDEARTDDESEISSDVFAVLRGVIDRICDTANIPVIDIDDSVDGQHEDILSETSSLSCFEDAEINAIMEKDPDFNHMVHDIDDILGDDVDLEIALSLHKPLEKL